MFAKAFSIKRTISERCYNFIDKNTQHFCMLN